MTIGEVEEYMQQKALKELPSLMEKAGLSPLRYYADAPNKETDTYAVGIYLYSPNGSVFEQDGNAMKAYVTFDGVVDCLIDDSCLGSKYAAVIIEWLHTSPFDMVSVVPTLAMTRRVDGGDDYNGFAVLAEISLDYLFDGIYRR